MASNITFRGEINHMSASYFIREMETMPARSAANIYLHTPGGDIYDGGEMVNSLRDACKERGCKFNLTLGSLVASMGASLLAAAKARGATVTAHANTEAMFHGCYGGVVGGSQSMADAAKQLNDFNLTVKEDLARLGIEDTDEWFAEGRMKFLNAKELKALGLVDRILDDEAEDEDLKSDALKIAAMYNKEESKMDETKVQEEETPAPVAEAPKFDAVRAEVVAEEKAKSDARAAALQSMYDKKLAEKDVDFSNLTTKCDSLTSRLSEVEAAIKAKDAELTSKNAEIEKLNADHAEAIKAKDAEAAHWRAQYEESERNRKAVAVAAMTPDPELPKFEDGLAACRTPAERSAFIASGKYRK